MVAGCWVMFSVMSTLCDGLGLGQVLGLGWVMFSVCLPYVMGLVGSSIWLCDWVMFSVCLPYVMGCWWLAGGCWLLGHVWSTLCLWLGWVKYWAL